MYGGLLNRRLRPLEEFANVVETQQLLPVDFIDIHN